MANDSSYDLLAAIDVLEHVRVEERFKFLKELTRISRRYVLLNYPCKHTFKAQELVFRATGNSLVREHVEFELPDTDQIIAQMSNLGFDCSYIAYGNLAVWLGQYLTLNLAPQIACDLNHYLVDNHSDEPFSVPLYHLVVCERQF